LKKNTICLFFASILLFCLESKISFAQNIIFVTQTGGGSQSGASWANAKSGADLPGILSTASGNQIWIAEGIYTPSVNNDRSARFKINHGCKVYGGFAGTETQLSQRDSSLTIHKTILSGEIQNDNTDTNNTYNIVQINEVNKAVYLNSLIVEKANDTPSQQALDIGGLNLQHATVYLNNMGILSNKGAGIYIQGANVYINNSKIHDNDNYRGSLGGGIMIESDVFVHPPHQNYVAIENTAIHDNYAIGGGGLYFRFLTPTDTLIMENCKINNNTAGVMGGAGLWITGGNDSTSSVVLNKVEMKGNSSQVWNDGGEGLNMNGGNLFVNDAVIAENYNGGGSSGGSGYGGGVFLQLVHKARFVNCTFANNSSDTTPGLVGYDADQIFIESPNVKFENCIFKSSKGNTHHNFGPPQSDPYYFHDVSFANCLFDGDFPVLWTDSGNNITNTDPYLTGQYELSQNSPAIDAGNNSFRNVNYSDDLAGNPRIINGIVDLGATEFQENEGGNANGVAELAAKEVIVYPNPFTERIIIKSAKVGSVFYLYNISGQAVLQGTIKKPVQEIDLSRLANGAYLLNLTSTDNRNIVLKCVKQ